MDALAWWGEAAIQDAASTVVAVWLLWASGPGSKSRRIRFQTLMVGRVSVPGVVRAGEAVAEVADTRRDFGVAVAGQIREEVDWLPRHSRRAANAPSLDDASVEALKALTT
jgi:hypothetical protein